MFTVVVAYLGDEVGKFGARDFDVFGSFNAFAVEMRAVAVVVQVVIEFCRLVAEISSAVCDLVNRRMM